MTSPSDRLTFTRQSERRTADDKLRDQLEFIAQRALAGNRGRGWSYEIGPIESIQYISWTFSAFIRFYRTRPVDPDREQEQRREIYEWAAAAGHNTRFGPNPWTTKIPRQEQGPALGLLSAETKAVPESGTNIEPDGPAEPEPVERERDSLEDQSGDPTPLSSISRVHKGRFFDHLYGLDSQINMVLSAVQAAADSNMENRFHTLLHGAPACGKTDILLSTSKLLDSLGVSYLVIDAVSMTDAGLRKSFLDEDSILPEVVIVEEVEKTPENNLRIFLGLMDDRAVISQHNARKVATRKVPALVLATANDYNLLRKMMYGALLSRFSNEIFCPRPNREILAKFLKREVDKVKGGDLAWIEPTLEFCHDKRGITDPRMLKRICLCGKDRLLSGEYQLDLEKTMKLPDEGGQKSGSGISVNLKNFT